MSAYTNASYMSTGMIVPDEQGVNDAVRTNRVWLLATPPFHSRSGRYLAALLR